MKSNIFNTTGNFALSFLLIVMGVSFFFLSDIPWILFYLFTLAYCILSIYTTSSNIRHGYKQKDPIDTLLNWIHVVCIFLLLFFPKQFVKYAHLFYGIWMLGMSFLDLVEYLVLRRDGLPGTITKLLATINTFLFGLFMVFGHSFSVKTWILSVVLGFYFLIYGIHSLLSTIRMRYPDSYVARHSTWTLSAPLLVSAFLPVSFFTSIHAFDASDNDPELDDSDIHVYVYMKGTGFQMFGHVDIGYKGKIYSYGCHDPFHRKLFGTVGDGVLIVVDEKKFIGYSMKEDQKAVIRYGIRLTDQQRETFEKKLKEMMKDCVVWDVPKTTEGHQYCWNVYRGTGCDFYKFRSGKFHTYFVASTNCVLVADYLIRNRELSLVYLYGIVTPGAYLTFLNNAYIQKNSNVVSRVVYDTVH